MADEVTVSASLAYEDSTDTDEALAIANLLADSSGKQVIRHKQSIGTSEEAIVLGEVTSPGWAIFVNRDPTNFIELRVASGGAKFAKLLAGEFACLRLGSGAQVPYAISDTAACKLEYLLIMT